MQLYLKFRISTYLHYRPHQCRLFIKHWNLRKYRKPTLWYYTKILLVSMIVLKHATIFFLRYFTFTKDLHLYLFLLIKRNLKRIFTFTKKKKARIMFSIYLTVSHYTGRVHPEQWEWHCFFTICYCRLRFLYHLVWFGRLFLGSGNAPQFFHIN